MTVDDRIQALRQTSALLDEAIALADAAGETLIGAHIAQAQHALETRFVELHGATVGR